MAGYSTPLSVVKPLLRNKYVITVRWKEQATSISEVKRLFREGGHKISFLFTGDSCFSEGELISRFLDEVDRYEVIPGISSVQVASAKSMFPLEVCSVISFHVTGGPLNQRKESLRSVLEKGGCALVLPPRPYDFMPREVSRYLVESGIPPDLPVRIMENLTRGDERITDCTIGSVPDRQYSDLCIMALGRSPLHWITYFPGQGRSSRQTLKINNIYRLGTTRLSSVGRAADCRGISLMEYRRNPQVSGSSPEAGIPIFCIGGVGGGEA